MNKFIILLSLSFVLGAYIAHGQETYFVLSKNGKVQVYLGGSEKHDVALSEALAEDAKLWIAKDADLRLRDKSGHVYTLPGASGDWLVRDYVKKAQSKETRSFFGQFASGLMKVFKNDSEPKIQRNMGTRRGNDDMPCFEDTVYASLCEYRKFTTFGVIFEKIQADNGLIWFRVTNETTENFYCNIISEDSNRHKFVCYESGWFGKYDVFPLPGNTTIEMRALPLSGDSYNLNSYVLVRSRKPLRVDVLQELLNKGMNPVPNASSTNKVDCVKAR